MKRLFLMLTFLVPLSAFAMQDRSQLHEPSKITRKYVERALKAFEIPIESIKIYGFINPKGSCAGWANSDTKEIAIQETGHEFTIEDDLSTSYTCFHEAAHIKDECSRKNKSYAKSLTTTMLLGYCALGSKLFAQSKKIISSPFAMYLTFSYATLGYYFGYWFHNNVSIPWGIEQAEYRADKMAIEKLLEKNEFDPILFGLFHKLAAQQEYGNQRTHGHPPAKTEYKAMKKTLEKNGCEVRKYSPADTPNDLIITLTRNSKSRYIYANNFYSKV